MSRSKNRCLAESVHGRCARNAGHGGKHSAPPGHLWDEPDLPASFGSGPAPDVEGMFDNLALRKALDTAEQRAREAARGKQESLQLAKDCLAAAKREGLEIVSQPIAEWDGVTQIGKNFEFRNVRTLEAERRFPYCDKHKWLTGNDDISKCPQCLVREYTAKLVVAEQRLAGMREALRELAHVTEKWHPHLDPEEPCIVYGALMRAKAALSPPPSPAPEEEK